MSKSSTILKDLANGNFPAEEKQKPNGKRVLSGFDQDHGVSSDTLSIINRLVVVSNELPVKYVRKTDENGGLFWDFTWDENSLYIHIKDSLLAATMEVYYVGLLRANVEFNEQDDVETALIDRFNCLPVFISPELVTRYYRGFCKQYLWPIFHYKLPFSDRHGGRFDKSFWEAYVTVNNRFLWKVIEALNSVNDYVWIHDYHLMVLPTLLRRHYNRLRLGFFLHSPFPSSEVFRCIPMRTEILKGLLNSDIIGFHTFDYSRHFLSCCSRMLGLEYELKRGYISLDYHGRIIRIKIMHSGINVSQMESVLIRPNTKLMVRELERQFQGKTVLIGVDDLDRFKGVNSKVIAMEQMLKSNPNWLRNVVLVQILNPARGQGPDVAEIDAEIRSSCERINKEMGSPGYEPIVLVNRPISLGERAAYYAISEAAIVTPVCDGMNLMPYEYVVCRQGDDHRNYDSSKTSMLVVSEFIGCSPTLSGAIRVNPWDVKATAEAMNTAISSSDDRKQLGHIKHYRYITTHDIANWSRSFVRDLQTSCIAHNHNNWRSLGLALTFGVAIFNSNFQKLTAEVVENAYRRSRNRAILLDYDHGTIMPSINKHPTDIIISIINQLCDDPRNTVFVISGRSKENLGRWFGPCEKLAIAAEHGYFIRFVYKYVWVVLFFNAWARNTYSLLVQGVDKGTVATKIFETMAENGRQADFVLCIGDDRSDEDMFVAINGDGINNGQIMKDGSVFACTVGQKPTAAEYYLDDTAEVLTLLETLTLLGDR
ncbi:hypothetical protein L6452_35594 [Arctium lappa]|uniref:Uncharacterized protein n=1 Tax=Arctium lappa TaxID=4217 RepID=A0ACB8Y825_ARCLA|nr:hypothetical protein L6452_35594 [Arctium lappa]